VSIATGQLFDFSAFSLFQLLVEPSFPTMLFLVLHITLDSLKITQQDAAPDGGNTNWLLNGYRSYYMKVIL